MIDTRRGPLDESTLVRVTGVENGPVDVFAWVEWRDAMTGEVLRKDRTAGFKKSPGSGTIMTTAGLVPESALNCRVILVDNENEFTLRQEFLMDGVEVQSSVDVNLKKGIEALATAAALPAEQPTA